MMRNANNIIFIPWLGIGLAFLICAFLLAPILFRQMRPPDSPSSKGLSVIPQKSVQEAPPSEAAEVVFKAPTLIAKAAAVYDVAQGKELFSHNPETQLPLASLTKIMTALTAREMLAPEQTVVIGDKTLKADGDGLLKTGTSWQLGRLLDWTLVRSSNDGAVAIASAWEGVVRAQTQQVAATSSNFVAAMNTRAKELGLTQTYFLNETGLDLNEELSGSYGSARDINKLFVTAVREFPDSFEATRYHDLTVSAPEGSYKTKNTNGEVDTIPGIIASKTGFTDLAGGNLTILFDAGPDHPIAITVLGSTQEGRLTDVANLVKATLNYLQKTDGL